MFGDAYGGGATQYGGGFMASQADKGGPSPAPKNATGHREGLRAVTNKQLLDFIARVDYADEHQDLYNVTLVGKIIVMKPMQSTGLIEFKLYDGTGTFLIHHYLNEEDELAVQKSSEWQVGTYVRVHGNLSDFDGNYRIQAFNVRAITDFNEVTYHNLQAIYQHLHITKGMPGSGRALAENNAQTGAQGGGGAMYGGAAGGGGGGGGAMGGGGGGGLDDVGDDGLTNLQRQVKDVISLPMHADSNREGATLQSILGQCPTLNPKQVQEALAFLSDQGAIYTTCDEYHFKAC